MALHEMPFSIDQGAMPMHKAMQDARPASEEGARQSLTSPFEQFLQVADAQLKPGQRSYSCATLNIASPFDKGELSQCL